MFRSNSSRRFKKHIDSFKNHPNLSPSTRNVSKGVYDTVFECKGGQVFVLRVDCRAEPVVKMFGCRAEHPLMDSDMYVRIAYHDEKLLGAAVMDTIVQMQLNPPQIVEFTEDCVRTLQREPTSGSSSSEDPPTQQNPPLEDPRPPTVIATAIPNVSLEDTRSSTHPVQEVHRNEPEVPQSFAPGFKDQAQTVIESGANTPSVVSELPLVEARLVAPHEMSRLSSGTIYSYMTSSES